MKFLIAFAAIVAVSTSSVLRPTLVTPGSQLEAAIAAINSPSTDPATAVLLQQQLLEILGIESVPIAPPSPILIDQFEPIHIGPTLIDFPVSDIGTIIDPIDVGPVNPSPEIPVPAPAPVPVTPAGGPLVQITVNVGPDLPGAVAVDQGPLAPDVAIVPDFVTAVPRPTPVFNPDLVPMPINVVEGPPEPVIIAPIPALPEPVLVGNPIFAPHPVVLLPIDL